MAELIILAAFAFASLVVLAFAIWMLSRQMAHEREEHRAELREFAMLVMSRSSTEFAVAHARAEGNGRSSEPREVPEQVGL